MTTNDCSQMTLPLGAPRRRASQTTVNGFARALAIVVRAGREAEMASKAMAFCPHCGHKGPIERDFGFRKMQGRVQAQSWCRSCRKAKARTQTQESLLPH